MKRITFLLLLVVSGVIGVSSVLAWRTTVARTGPPVASVTPQRAVIQTQPADRSYTASFNILNEGHQDLVFGDVETSCGCVVTAIEPRVLKPGETGIIRVEGTPPERGERIVSVKVATKYVRGRECSSHHGRRIAADPPCGQILGAGPVR